MLSIYHRVQKPFVYQTLNGKIKVQFRIAKNAITKAYVLYGDEFRNITHKKNLLRTEMTPTCETYDYIYYEAQLSTKTKRYLYVFEIYDNNDNVHYFGEIGFIRDQNRILDQGSAFSYSYWDKENFLQTPTWFKSTNWYQIFPDRFNRVGEQENFTPWSKKIPEQHELYGGNLKGITSKLDYIKDIGFSGIYLTPIFTANSSHRYNTINYFEVDPVLGSEEDLKELINEAHKRGIKIMLDAVFNHIGEQSPQWQDVLQNGKKSRYFDWFRINNVDKIHDHKNFKINYPFETFDFHPSMPKLNLSNREVCEHLFEASRKWTSMGIDGWRLDVAFEPPISFWVEFNHIVKSINKDIAIIGEVWCDSINYLENYVWNGVMNYPLRSTIIKFVESDLGDQAKRDFVNELNTINIRYTPEQLWGMFNLLSSHDVPRLISQLRDRFDRFKLAFSLMFFSPGSTSTYYGEEIWLHGGDDPDNRRPMPWEQEHHDMTNFFKKLIIERDEFMKEVDIFDRFKASYVNETVIIENDKLSIMIDNNNDFQWKRKV